MRTEYMQYIIEIAEKGSINKASLSLNFAPQKLSRVVSIVENECGYKLFDRTSKGVILTKEGEEFLKNARDVMALMDDIYIPNSKKKCATEINEEVEIYHVHSTPTEFLLPAILAFIEKFPSIHLMFNETSYSNIISSIQNSNKLAMGMVAYLYPFDNYEAIFRDYLSDLIFIPFLKSRPVVIFSDTHPFYNRYQKISLKTIIQYPATILYSNGSLEECITYKLLKNYGDPVIQYAVTNLDLFYQLLTQGSTFGIAAEKNVSSNQLQKMSLVENIYYTVGFVFHKKNKDNRLLREFLENIQRDIKDKINVPI